MNSRQYITLNRASEWNRGAMLGLKTEGNCVVLSDDTGISAAFITASADSTEHNFRWKSFKADIAVPDSAAIRVYAYCANTAIVSVGGVPAELDSYLADKTLPAEEKFKNTAGLFKLVGTDTDCPIDLMGRYIWLKFEFVLPEERSVRISRIKLLLKSESMMDHLPEVYRAEDGENGFMSRYMSLFDSIFFEMDDKIAELHESFDYQSAGIDMLRTLAQWLNIEDAAYLSDTELRVRIAFAAEGQRECGTRHGIAQWIENEYGVVPNIIEYYSVKRMINEGKDRETYRRLFGDNPYRFFILLPENTFEGTHDANIFMEKLRRRVPANTQPEIVLIRQSVILENHTYLGVNSVLGGYSEAGADTGNRISHDLILGGSQNDK